MVEIIAVPDKIGNKDLLGPTFTRLQIVAFQPIVGNPGAGMISPELSSDKEIDEYIAHIIKEAEKAGRAAKKIIGK